MLESVAGKKVGIPSQWYDQATIDPSVKKAWDQGMRILQDAGCTVVPVTLPSMDYALPCYYVLACAEAASNLQRYDGVKYGFRADNVRTLEDMYTQTRGQGFGAEVKRRIMIGCFVLSHGYYDAYYTKAQKVRSMIRQEFQDIFQHVDVLLTPTTPTPAFSLDSPSKDPVAMYWNDILTVPVNIGNACAISVPAGVSPQGLPMGLQIIAPAMHEQRLFQYGHIIEQSITMPPLPF
jgi:aspartyl-tRNA(Asn)/glutamyl-tRNA(Gln) amidotransferase subunit A